MMDKPDWIHLNAYVDGELPPDAAAEVAAWVAADPEIAAQVAALARLKASAGAAFDAGGEVPTVRFGRAPGRRRWQAIAAGFALAFGIAGASWLMAPQPDAAEAWLDRIGESHREWLADDPAPKPLDATAVVLADMTGGMANIPDLGIANLAVAHVAVTASGRQPGLYVGYVGANGCRLGLWIGKAPDALPLTLTEHRIDGLRGFVWRTGGTGYAVVARGMNEARLEAVAAYLERLTRDRRTRVARAPQAADAPCLG